MFAFFTAWLFAPKRKGKWKNAVWYMKKAHHVLEKRGELFLFFVQKIKCFVQISGESRRTLTEMFYELKTIISRLCVNRR